MSIHLFKKSGKSRKEALSYDKSRQIPVIRCSICNGEQVGGLKDLETGHFEEVMLIRGSEDLYTFQQLVGTKDIGKEY